MQNMCSGVHSLFQLRMEVFFCFSHIFNEILQYIEILCEFKVGNQCAYFKQDNCSMPSIFK